MTRLLLLAIVICSCQAVTAEDSTAEIAALKARISALKSENQRLRSRLREIADLATRAGSSPRSELVIKLESDDWGDAAPPDVLKVLHSAALPIWEASGSPALHPLAVVSSSSGPLVAYKRTSDGDYRVLVNVKGRQWAQLAFQFSHEMAHILANYRDVSNRQLWFEESICECASLYSLRQMGKHWKTLPPYPNWRSYADSLTKYADDRIGKATSIPDDDLAAWYATNKATLDADATDRELNLVVAVKLLPIFEKHRNSWTAVRSLNRGNAAENETLDRYLEAWYSRVAESDRPLVRDIAALFMLTLPASQ